MILNVDSKNFLHGLQFLNSDDIRSKQIRGDSRNFYENFHQAYVFLSQYRSDYLFEIPNIAILWYGPFHIRWQGAGCSKEQCDCGAVWRMTRFCVLLHGFLVKIPPLAQPEICNKEIIKDPMLWNIVLKKLRRPIAWQCPTICMRTHWTECNRSRLPTGWSKKTRPLYIFPNI